MKTILKVKFIILMTTKSRLLNSILIDTEKPLIMITQDNMLDYELSSNMINLTHQVIYKFDNTSKLYD